jgi:hypothetical protein
MRFSAERVSAVSRCASSHTARTPDAPTTLFVGHTDPRVDASVRSCAMAALSPAIVHRRDILLPAPNPSVR